MTVEAIGLILQPLWSRPKTWVTLKNSTNLFLRVVEGALHRVTVRTVSGGLIADHPMSNPDLSTLLTSNSMTYPSSPLYLAHQSRILSWAYIHQLNIDTAAHS
uniref:Uncharacterized protein n=1 Tax=Schistocephalus solidus TaxID=70667 RepID=A0A0X3PPF8_SCHSO